VPFKQTDPKIHRDRILRGVGNRAKIKGKNLAHRNNRRGRAMEKELIKPYRIDNEPADMHDIIDLAKTYGYAPYGNVYQTSVASGILRKNGHTVDNNPLANNL
jgi:hypothetical protein